jgi:hypothetical protein
MTDPPTITREQADALYQFLQGHPPDVLRLSEGHQPALTAAQAFSVLYYLQEILAILPDKYERCEACDFLFDREAGGGDCLTTDGLAAEGLRLKHPNYEGLICCQGCFWNHVEGIPDWDEN